MRRRMAQMNARLGGSMGAAPGPPPQAAAQAGGDSQDGSGSGYPGAGQVAGGQNNMNPGKPGMSGQPNQAVNDVLEKVKTYKLEN